MFKILRPALCKETDLRERLGQARIGERPKDFVPRPVPDFTDAWAKARLAAEGKSTDDGMETSRSDVNGAEGEKEKEWLWEYVQIIEELGIRMEVRLSGPPASTYHLLTVFPVLSTERRQNTHRRRQSPSPPANHHLPTYLSPRPPALALPAVLQETGAAAGDWRGREGR
jgi:hypothetical protein